MADMKSFINPYNFIPMEKEKATSKRDDGKQTYTGVIEYSVLTKSPLFIPNTSNDKTFEPSYTFVPKEEGQEHKSYDFYSYHDLGDTREDRRVPQTWEEQYFRPVIPGSEIRGMFRSNFEILTNSCLSSLDTDTKLSKRTMERFSAGLLRRKGNFFELYSAKDALWRTKGKNSAIDENCWKGKDKDFYTRECYIQKDFPEGCHVSFTEEIRGGRGIKSLAKQVCFFEKQDLRMGGYILKGEKGPEMKQKPGEVVSQKHCCHIFYAPSKDKISGMIPLEGNQLDLTLQEYEKIGANTYKEYREQWEQFKKKEDGEYFPVYYSQIKSGGKEVLFLSPACITREVYEHSLMDLAGGLKPCGDRETLCPACSLFGTVMRTSAVASRIRFSDLEGEERADYRRCYEPPTTLPPLSSPKLNNMEFYVKHPDKAWFWTYDYYIDAAGNIQLRKGELAGRKFYWHNIQNLDMLKKSWVFNGTANHLNITVRPVRQGYRFQGALYFKKLTQKELDLLIYLINAGDEKELSKKKHGYKLGAAKPLGFGSIACHVDRVKLVSYQKKEHAIVRQEKEYTSQVRHDLVEGKIEENFEKMTNFTTASEKGCICYPRMGDGSQPSNCTEAQSEEGSNGYEWFVANHGGYNHRKQRKEEMASSRANMLYYQYMDPMEPMLKKTGAGVSSSCDSQGKNAKPYEQNKKWKNRR